MKCPTMKTTILGFGLTLLLAGCGSGETNLAVSPAAAQAGSGVGQLEGIWSGEIDATNSVALTIHQEDGELWGDGIVFQNDNPLPVQLQGSVDGDSFELTLYPEAPEATEDLLLQGQLKGANAECYLGSEDEYDDRPLTLQRASDVQARLDDNTAAGLPQRLVVDLTHPNGNVQAVLTLEEVYWNGSTVFEGHWASNQPLGPLYLGDPQVQGGLVTGGGVVGKPDWCQFYLWSDPNRLSAEVAKLIFRRPQGVGSRFIVPLDQNSWMVRDQSERPLGSHPTAKRQYVGGSVSPVVSNP